MISAIGGSAPSNPMCCMVCSPTAFSDGGRLDVLQVKKTVRKKRRVAVRKIDDSQVSAMKLRLEIERAKYITEHTTLGILGAQLVCPDSVIKMICNSAKFISVIEDMDLFCLRHQLKDPFFNAIIAVVHS